MKVAIIGSRKSIEIVKSTITKGYFFIEPVFFTFCNYSEVLDILKINEDKVDAILFTGYTTYKYASNFLKPTVPWEYIPRDRMSFVYTILKAIHINRYDISKISIDSYDEKVIYDTYKEIGYEREVIHIYKSKYDILSNDYFEKLANFHISCFENRKVNLCVTCIFDVYEMLLKNNIPCVHVDYSTDIIMEYINKLRLRHQLKISEDSNIVTLNISVEILEENSIYSKNELQKLKYMNKIHESIYSYSQRIGAATIKLAENNYYIFTTKLVLENDTRSFKRFELLDKIHNNPNIKNIYIGVGLGNSPLESKCNAEIARKKSEKSDMSCIFIIDKDNKITGPITNIAKYSEVKKVDKHLLEISERTGVGITTIHKIESIIKQYNITTITPNELAELCGVSTRSINRIITKLEDKEYIRIVGKKTNSSNGRPSRLIEIDFNSNFKVY